MRARHGRLPRRAAAALMTAMLAGLAPATQADEAASAGAWRDPVDQPSELMPQAAHALLLGLTEVGNAAVAVGAHGIVLRSTDRSHWEQVADVPTRSTLTAVTAVGNKLWAVGHDGVILASADAGQHWTLQRKDPWHAPPGDAATSDPRQGTPLLDVLFLDESNGFAVGAYSQLLVTHDGGTTWAAQRVARPAAGASEAGPAAGETGTFTREQLAIGEEADPHFNAIARTGDGSLFIAGERGVAFRSRDQGATWQHLKWPYNGSMFGVIGFEGAKVLVFGLRGHAYESADLGEHWTEVATGTELSLLGGVRLANGGAALVGANGLVLLRRSGTEPFRAGVAEPSGALASALVAEGGNAFTVVGENGVMRYQPRQ